MSTKEGVVAGTAAGPADARGARSSRLAVAATAVIWLAGSAIVSLAQPGADRKEAAAGAAAAAIGLILVTGWLTKNRELRYFRSLLAGMVAVSLTSTWLVRRLTGATSGFRISGLETRIALPLLFVLFLPLVAAAVPRELWRPAALWERRRRARPLDWIVLAYALLVVPGLALGLAHHAPRTYVAQDLGLVVFFVFMYIAGRVAKPEVVGAAARELVDVLLALAVVQLVLTGWEPSPLYTYIEAACAGAIAFALLRPGRSSFLGLGLAVTILVTDAVNVHAGSNSSTAILLSGALAVLLYVAVRLRPVVPRWLIVVGAVAALVVFVGFTNDGRALRGQYHGPDPSNAGRTFEAERVRAAVRRSPVSVVFGRGFGGTIDERGASKAFKGALLHAGRDVAHVQEVHLLDYEFLLKHGMLGLAWLAAFAVALVVIVLRALEWAARRRDPAPVVYAALPLLGVAIAFAAATHLQVNPLNALALGALVTFLGTQPATPEQ